MHFSEELTKTETLEDVCKGRDYQAQLIMQIFQLASKLKVCTNEVANKIRYPEFIKDEDIESIRQTMDYGYWRNFLEINQVEKYLTSNDKEKLFEKLSKNTPLFNFENATNMLNEFMNSKEATATNMIKKIYEEITDMVFRIGNKGKNEKRIQTGIPEKFRLSIFYSHYGFPSYVSDSNSRFTMIDDLERACYLCDGKLQPDRQFTIRSTTALALREGRMHVENDYFSMQMFLNGNVKITFTNLDVLNRLNHWGQKGNRIK